MLENNFWLFEFLVKQSFIAAVNHYCLLPHDCSSVYQKMILDMNINGILERGKMVLRET